MVGSSGGPFGCCCFSSSLLLGGAASPLLFCWVVLLPLLSSVVVLLHLFSSVGWCGLPSPPLGGGALSPARFGLVFFKFLGTSTTQRGRGRQHDQKEEEAKQLHPQGRGGKAAPLKEGGGTTTQLHCDYSPIYQ